MLSLSVVALLSLTAFAVCGLYRIHRLHRSRRELRAVLRGCGLAFLLTTAAIAHCSWLAISPALPALFAALLTPALLITRRTLHRVQARSGDRRPHLRRAVIIGQGRIGHLVAETVRNNPWTGIRVVGFVDGEYADRGGFSTEAGLPRVGDIDDLPSIVARERIEHVFVALPLSRYGELSRLWRLLAELLVDVQMVPDVPKLAGARIKSLEIDDVGFLSLRENPHCDWNGITKRSLDLALGTAALVLLSPLMFVLAVLVKASSPGPILFSQSRAGLKGQPFNMLKFRSMRVDAEKSTGPVWAIKGDQRCTRLGGFMRRWSLDELPQLFNVLAGDMSLVGPRPERPYFIEKFRDWLPSYTQRLQVKPGMTGWAQVNGWRGDSSLRRRLECDLDYIANWSMWLDLRILWLTPWHSFCRRNAH